MNRRPRHLKLSAWRRRRVLIDCYADVPAEATVSTGRPALPGARRRTAEPAQARRRTAQPVESVLEA